MEIIERSATVPVRHYAMGELAAVPVAGHLMDWCTNPCFFFILHPNRKRLYPLPLFCFNCVSKYCFYLQITMKFVGIRKIIEEYGVVALQGEHLMDDDTLPWLKRLFRRNCLSLPLLSN